MTDECAPLGARCRGHFVGGYCIDVDHATRYRAWCDSPLRFDCEVCGHETVWTRAPAPAGRLLFKCGACGMVGN